MHSEGPREPRARECVFVFAVFGCVQGSILTFAYVFLFVEWTRLSNKRVHILGHERTVLTLLGGLARLNVFVPYTLDVALCRSRSSPSASASPIPHLAPRTPYSDTNPSNNGSRNASQ
ncbi:hypothetical protein BD410DRAFT_494617 [Rickenella mellea]|uniref:Uncharacterized protein n=1 Tax=Rickenella mellea TaxID=50990 RepID=A0A4Y7PFW6_9AGAM|nr:hypothetical protein BD410DRAFT_494617 [Rickenella mellea]